MIGFDPKLRPFCAPVTPFERSGREVSMKSSTHFEVLDKIQAEKQDLSEKLADLEKRSELKKFHEDLFPNTSKFQKCIYLRTIHKNIVVS